MSGQGGRTLALLAALALEATAVGRAPHLPAIDRAIELALQDGEIAGAVTAVADKERVLHFAATGHAEIATGRPMAEDSIFWIASMTKLVTGVAVLMLEQD